MIIVDAFVPGAAKTKGSMEIINKRTGAMRESVIGSPKWRALMAQAVKDDITRRHRPPAYPAPWPTPYAGAVVVTVVAYLAPPADPGPGAAAILRTWYQRAVEVWRNTGLPIWDRAGDLDKLVRNVLDAIGSTSKNSKMNGGAIVDDNLVCRLVAEKAVAGSPHTTVSQPGVRIIVETL